MSTRYVSDSLLHRLALPLPACITRKLLALDGLDELWNRAATLAGSGFERLLAALDVEYACDPQDLPLIPRTGPAMVMANHPHGFLDGMLLGSLLGQIRGDVKIISNSLLSFSPEFSGHFIGVNVFESASAQAANSKALREAMRWLESGGMLVVFPAGSVSRFRCSQWTATDAPWSPHFASLAKRVSAKVIPMYIAGSNRVRFHLLSLIEERLGTAMLARELVAKQGSRVSISVGQPIPAEALSRLDRNAATEYIRFRAYLLANRQRQSTATPASSPSTPATPIHAERLADDIELLPASAKLYTTDDYSVYVAKALEIPNILQEIGRLREVSFRAEGEGTGYAIDLDQFDEYYHHLFVWHHTRQEVVGAYRLGLSEEIIRDWGTWGLYTTTLFRFPDSWWSSVAPAIELGRSFIRLEHQRSYGALLALWRGIGAFLERHPQYRYLFGPVSISGRYKTASKQLIASYLQSGLESQTAPLVKARTPPHSSFQLKRDMEQQPLSILRLEDIDSMIKDIEPDRCGLPVLLRHYVNLGGRILAFNEDARFSSAVDGLLLIDLLNADLRRLDRFLGKGVIEKIVAMAAKDHAAA